MQHRRGRRRHAFERDDRPEAETLEHRQVQPSDGARDVRQRVRAGIAVVGGVRKRAHAAGVRDDDERAAAHEPVGARSFSERVIGPKVCSSIRAKSFGGANASMTTSAPRP